MATKAPRSSVRRSFRVGTMIRPGAAGMATMFGTATTTQPAAVADSTPVGESSMATHCTGSTPSRDAARRYGSGCGLPWRTASPVITAWNVIGASASTTASVSRLQDIVTSAHGTPLALRSASRRRAPGRQGRAGGPGR